MKALRVMFLDLLLLAGCAHWQAGPDAPFVRWKCQGGQHIAWRYADKARSAVDLRVGDDATIHRLRKEPATLGTFYSDGNVAFHDKGSTALVYRVADDRLLAHGCSASLVNF